MGVYFGLVNITKFHYFKYKKNDKINNWTMPILYTYVDCSIGTGSSFYNNQRLIRYKRSVEHSIRLYIILSAIQMSSSFTWLYLYSFWYILYLDFREKGSGSVKSEIALLNIKIVDKFTILYNGTIAI